MRNLPQILIHVVKYLRYSKLDGNSLTGFSSNIMPAIPTQVELFHEKHSSAVICRDLGIDHDSFDRLEYILEQSKDEGTNFQEDISHDPDLVAAYKFVLSKGYVWH